jgi:uncharacterized protein
VSHRVSERAAHRAALFMLSIFAVMFVGLQYTGAAHAKMRNDRLIIEPAAGGTARAINIEIAETDEEKMLGLMFRTSLDDGHGMLFPYGATHEMTMWMRNTYISLDMLFIRADGVIHRIEARAEPLSDRQISSGGPVSAVLELAGGAAERLNLKPGDKVRHPLFGAPGVAAPKN